MIASHERRSSLRSTEAIPIGSMPAGRWPQIKVRSPLVLWRRPMEAAAAAAAATTSASDHLGDRPFIFSSDDHHRHKLKSFLITSGYPRVSVSDDGGRRRSRRFGPSIGEGVARAVYYRGDYSSTEPQTTTAPPRDALIDSRLSDTNSCRLLQSVVKPTSSLVQCVCLCVFVFTFDS